MSLSSLQLEAFLEVARSRNFSRAAKALHITQSALSQRVLNLEEELELSLFVREPSGVRLTEAGETLLRHCQVRASLEEELLTRLRGRARGGMSPASELGGVLRIGAFSSVMVSAVLPGLASLLQENPALQIQALTRGPGELLPLLRSGEIDFAILDSALDRGELEIHPLGFEEYQLYEGLRLPKERTGICFDNDPEDHFTERYFQAQGEKPAPRARSFLSDIHGIIEGVALGWGRGVLPRHLVHARQDLRKVPGFKPLRVKVFLHYYRQPYYSALQKRVIDTLCRECPRILK